MSLPSPVRLLCLCLAAFFLVHLALGLLVTALTPVAVRLAGRLKPRSASHWLLALRLLPVAGSLFVVAVLCVPSYLWLEPEEAAEEVGVACLLAAALGALVWCISIARALRTSNRSLQHISEWRRASRPQDLPGESTPVWVMEGNSGSLMLAGILHPQVFISAQALRALAAPQLSVALRHERAHLASHDNLKRLLILLTPGLLPLVHGFAAMDRAWARFSEWAADDVAAGGDPQRSLALASALVRVARLSPLPAPSPLVTSLFDRGAELEARVDRLLNPAPTEVSTKRSPLLPAGALAMAAMILAVVLRPGTFYSVHEMLERLIH